MDFVQELHCCHPCKLTLFPFVILDAIMIVIGMRQSYSVTIIHLENKIMTLKPTLQGIHEIHTDTRLKDFIELLRSGPMTVESSSYILYM